MTYLNMPRSIGNQNKNKMPQGNKEGHRPHAHQSGTRRRGGDRVSTEASARSDQSEAQSQIDRIVGEGRQEELDAFFKDWADIPARIGDWEIRVNIRRVDNVPVSRTIVALPLAVRTRALFEQGCLATLKNAGFSDEDAKRYYQFAHKKKYVWVDSVIPAVKEMVDAFQNTNVLDAYDQAGDPRRLAMQNKVPVNPYLTSHSHFLVAVEMAKCIINARNADELPGKEVEEGRQQEPSAPVTTMVMA